MSEEVKYKVGDELLVRTKILEVDGRKTHYRYLLSASGRLSEEELDRITVGAPQKPIIPRFMADIIVSLKKNDMTLYDALNIYSFDDDINEIDDWVQENSDTFARAWLDGYEVEKEKRYQVRLVGLKEPDGKPQYLFKDRGGNIMASWLGTPLTQKELEEDGFGDVFDNPMFEIEEQG